MTILLFVFLPILLIVFGMIIFATRSTSEQKTVDRRISAIITLQTRSDVSNQKGRSFLTTPEAKPFGWLENLLGRTKIARELRALILQSQSPISMGTILMSMTGLTIGTGAIVYFWMSMPMVALIGAGMAACMPIALLRVRRNRRIASFNKALPDCIEMCARSLRAGHSIIAAIDIVADQAAEPAKMEFREVFRKQNYGLSLRDALMQMLDRVPSMDLHVMVTGILVQKDTGGNLAEILDRIVAVIRERLRIQGELKTNTAQGRLTGWILCLLPIVLLLAINVINPGYSSVLFHNPLGKKITYIGLMLLVAGTILIRQIIRGIEV